MSVITHAAQELNKLVARETDSNAEELLKELDLLKMPAELKYLKYAVETHLFYNKQIQRKEKKGVKPISTTKKIDKLKKYVLLCACTGKIQCRVRQPEK